NMQALLTAASAGDYPAEIMLVLSNNPEAAGLAWAASHGIATHAVDHRPFRGDRAAFDAELQSTLVRHNIELVALAGFMRLLTAPFVERWSGRMINIHPSLLPAFKGLDTHQRAIDAGCRIAGCTVHFVVPEMDAGPIIAQAATPIAPEDTADVLAARVLQAEHRLYPAALGAVAGGLCRLQGDRVVWADKANTTLTDGDNNHILTSPHQIQLKL
ncbi:MAG: phosphoribosylglycinamide formyltransferase, partial [Pseudomonadota bacterium]